MHFLGFIGQAILRKMGLGLGVCLKILCRESVHVFYAFYVCRDVTYVMQS